MRKLNIKLISVLCALVLIISVFPLSLTAEAAYSPPYLTDLRVFPYTGAEINGVSGKMDNTNNFISGIFLDWNTHGEYSWSDIYISETPIIDGNGQAYNLAGQNYASYPAYHTAAYNDINTNAYKLDKNDLAHNVASQTCAFIKVGARFSRIKDGVYSEYYFQHEPGKTYYIYIIAIGVDKTSGTNVYIPYVADCFEYTTSHSVATIPNGASNTIKFALVHNDDIAWPNTGVTTGRILRWKSVQDYSEGGEASADKSWTISYSKANGYSVTDNKNNGAAVECKQGGILNTSYGTFVDNDITVTEGTITNYFYMIYQTDTSCPVPVTGIDTTVSIPGPEVQAYMLGTCRNPETGAEHETFIPQRLNFEVTAIGKGSTDPNLINYRSHYRWTVMGIYTSYINTCKNTAEPDYSSSNVTYEYHTGESDCGGFHHADPIITRGGRFGLPGIPLSDAFGRIVTNTDGALVQEAAASDNSNYVTTNNKDEAIYDPTGVCFYFGVDYNEAPLYIDKNRSFVSDLTTTVTDCVTNSDLTRGHTYIFTFVSLYEYKLGERPPGWDHDITQAEIVANNGGNSAATSYNIFGTTYYQFTVPYMSVNGTHTPEGELTGHSFNGSHYSHNTYSALYQSENTPIDVTVAWNSLEFNLVGTWKPEEHKYSYAFNDAHPNSSIISVTNNGLADITVTGGCSVVEEHKSQIGCYLYDPSLSDKERFWISDTHGVDVTKNGGTKDLRVFVHAPDSFTRDDAQTFTNGGKIASVTVIINEKARIVNTKVG